MPIIARLYRFYFSVIGRILPGLALGTLWKLIFTPRKNPVKPHHLDCLNKAEKFDIHVPDYYHPGKSLRLQGYEWGSGNKTVLLVHGWDAKAIDYFKLIPELVENDFRVVSFDGPAHGESEGKPSNLVDFKNVIFEIIN